MGSACTGGLHWEHVMISISVESVKGAKINMTNLHSYSWKIINVLELILIVLNENTWILEEFHLSALDYVKYRYC